MSELKLNVIDKPAVSPSVAKEVSGSANDISVADAKSEIQEKKTREVYRIEKRKRDTEGAEEEIMTTSAKSEGPQECTTLRET